MIRYSCPTCKSVLESPDDKKERKVLCPKCGQKLQIPVPPSRNRTVLGNLLFQPGDQTSQPHGTEGSQQNDSRPSGRIAPPCRQEKNKKRMLVLAATALVIAGLFTCCGGIVILFYGWPSGPSDLRSVIGVVSEKKEGETWTHAELVSYLHKEGLE